MERMRRDLLMWVLLVLALGAQQEAAIAEMAAKLHRLEAAITAMAAAALAARVQQEAAAAAAAASQSRLEQLNAKREAGKADRELDACGDDPDEYMAAELRCEAAEKAVRAARARVAEQTADTLEDVREKLRKLELENQVIVSESSLSVPMMRLNHTCGTSSTRSRSGRIESPW